MAVENSQDREEEVQNVEVERDSSGDLLFHMVVSDDQLGVHKDVATEDERSNDAVAEFNALGMWEESSHETEQDQHPESTEQVWHPAREVVLRLASEQAQEDKDAECEDQRLHDNPTLVEGCYDRNRVCLQCREDSQEDQIHRIALPLPKREEHKSNSSEQRNPHHPLVRLDPCSERSAEEGHGGQGGGHEELDGKDRVDLADELHPDRESRLCDGAAELR